jgi:hypothetical protein
MGTDFDTDPFQELDYRESDGLEVSLLWGRVDNSLTVFVTDAKANETFELRVLASEAMDAFHHPYAYASFRSIEPCPLETAA